MAGQSLYQHKLGTPWTDVQIEQLIKELSACNELDAVDAIIWLRFELARVRNTSPQVSSRTR